jgi:hypothetical protein
MAAWFHSRYWDSSIYEAYRLYVSNEAPKFRGNTLDCADLSMLLLIEFASSRELPLTFRDNSQVRYISKAACQCPEAGLFKTKKWNNKDEFIKAVTKRIGAKALVNYNTVNNPSGPQPGDLMLKEDHASLVYKVYGPSAMHPKAYDKSIPVFPGNNIAKTQLNQTEYFRSPMPDQDDFRPNEIDAPWIRIDYLNHRGYGKEKAELIYYANAKEMTDSGFQFRMYGPSVLDNWTDWNGINQPPR